MAVGVHGQSGTDVQPRVVQELRRGLVPVTSHHPWVEVTNVLAIQVKRRYVQEPHVQVMFFLFFILLTYLW